MIKDFERVPANRDVLRFSPDRPDYISVDTELPTWETFAPSTDERGIEPVRVSVWDTELTTLDQARELVAMPDAAAFAFSAQSVLDLSTQTSVPMWVAYDPVPPPDDAKAGALGHAGLFGMSRNKAGGETKVERKARLDQLGEACRRVG